MERRKTSAEITDSSEHAEVSQDKRLQHYKQKLGLAVVDVVLADLKRKVKNMTLLAKGVNQARVETTPDKAQANQRKSSEQQTWRSGDKIDAFTEFDLERDYTMEEYQEIRDGFRKHYDLIGGIVGGITLRW